ncbi:MAG: type II secretion system protein GspL [Gammaproteobacteria bacterium]
MSETLVLRLPEAERSAEWVVVDALGNHMGAVEHGSLADATLRAKGRQIRVCVPANEVLLLQVQVPTRSSGKALQAIPFALEDQLAQDVETLHFALGARSGSGYSVAAVARTRMQHWLQELAAVGIRPAELVPDVLTLPVATHTLVLVDDATRMLARFPDGTGMVAGETLLPRLLRQHLEQMPEHTACTAVRVYSAAPQIPAEIAAFAADLHLSLEHQAAPLGAIGLMSAGQLSRSSIDLLQGEFGQHSGPRARWQRWRTAAALLAGLIVVLIAQQVVSEIHLRHETVLMHARVAALFHQALPDVTRMVDPQAQMQQRLNSLGGQHGGSSLLALLSSAGQILQSRPDVQLQALSFHNGVLQLQVQTSSPSALDTLKTALQQTSSVQASLDSISSNSGQTTARLTITGNGA